MRKLTQTTFGEGKGNCFSTCIACLFELEVEDVPNFCADHGDMWWRAFSDWLGNRGWSAVFVSLKSEGSWSASMACWAAAYCIISGKSPRGDFNHSVVGRMTGWPSDEFREGDCAWEFVWDPHPSGDFLDGDPHDFLFLIPNDPKYP